MPELSCGPFKRELVRAECAAHRVHPPGEGPVCGSTRPAPRRPVHRLPPPRSGLPSGRAPTLFSQLSL